MEAETISVAHLAEALQYRPTAQNVATAFIESYRDRGDSLPPEVEAAARETVGPDTVSEVLVAV